MKDLRARLYDRIDKNGPNGCWLWTGARNSNYGYGTIEVARVKRHVHRVLCELERGPVHRDLDLDHLCRNRICVNPDHLEPVSRRENILRGASHVAANARKTHCSKGHPFDEVNTYFRKDGG